MEQDEVENGMKNLVFTLPENLDQVSYRKLAWIICKGMDKAFVSHQWGDGGTAPRS
jgi:hypothetical protein